MPELYNTMANEGANLLIKCIQNLPDYLRNAKPQSDEGASYGKMVTTQIAHKLMNGNFCLYSSTKGD